MYIDRIALIALLSCVLLAPGILNWAIEGGQFWYRPYCIGLIVISVNAWLLRKAP